jgi:beta-phosphoglucomutase-like phosphatase (HAD superfamily)
VKLILVDDDGTLLDSIPVTPAEWRRALRSPNTAWMLLDQLTPGDQAVPPDNTPAPERP